jgi:hypothetical protein
MWILSIISGCIIYGTLTNMLYRDVFKQQKPINGDPNTNVVYFSTMIVSGVIVLYMFLSPFVCMRHKQDIQIIKKYKPLTKKVKDMTPKQKQYRKTGETAKERYWMYSCDPKTTFFKLWFFVSTLMALVLYPYTKKKQNVPLFVLLLIALTPLFIVVSGAMASSLWLLAQTPILYY